MNASSLSPTYRRTLALTILATIVAAVGIWVVQPAVGFVVHHSESRDGLVNQLERDRGIVQADTAVKDSIDKVSKSPQWQRLYTARTPEEGILQLQTDIRQMLGESITTLTPEAAVQKGPITQASIRLSAAMPMDRLAEMLQRVAQAPKFIRLQSITIQGPDAQAAASNPTLAVQLEAVAFVYVDQGKAPQ